MTFKLGIISLFCLLEILKTKQLRETHYNSLRLKWFLWLQTFTEIHKSSHDQVDLET